MEMTMKMEKHFRASTQLGSANKTQLNRRLST